MRDRKRSRFFPGVGVGGRSPGGLRKKLSDAGGLTVIEMLCATCILVLLCVMLATGLSMATYQYRMLTAEAETELLVNSIVSSLSDRLRENKLTVTVSEGGDGSYSYSIGEITTAQGNTYAGTTAPAMGTVILEKNVPLKDGELVAPLKVVTGSGAGETTTILPVGTKITIAGATATATLPADGGSVLLNPAGAVIIQQRALLPDGAYGAVLNKEGGAKGKKRRYQVQSLTVSASVTIKDGTKQDLSGFWPASLKPDDVVAVSYTIKLTVEDQVTHVTRSTPDDGIVVRCLNPVK